MGNTIIGIDLGGTNIRGAQIACGQPLEILSSRVNASGTEQEVLIGLFQLIDQLMDENVEAIGIGVPSVVDIEAGIVYDVQNIPSWKAIPLKKYVEERYHIPVFVNNDANCF